jgi:hypothetical protein
MALSPEGFSVLVYRKDVHPFSTINIRSSIIPKVEMRHFLIIASPFSDVVLSLAVRIRILPDAEEKELSLIMSA